MADSRAYDTADPRAYMRVYRALLDRGLPPGTQLHIGEIASEFDVSRGTVQKAIERLSGEVQLARYPGVGWTVIS